MNLSQRYADTLIQRKQSGRWRGVRRPGDLLPRIDFTHNDYLGLSRHPSIIAASQQAAAEYGLGGRASRLLGAESALLCELENAIATTKSASGSALAFCSGFQMNATVVATLLNPSLLDRTPQVFCDRLIHASLHLGIQHAGLRQHRFTHNDVDHLATLLKKHRAPNSCPFVFVESLYGMDGDQAPLNDLYDLKNRIPFFLVVDEAHATAVCGQHGYGLASQSDACADVVLGTFSKGIGSMGGFVVCHEKIRDLLINFCSGFIYSTAPSPVLAAAALAAWRLLPQMDQERKDLATASQYAREQLNRLGWNTGTSNSQIIPVQIGSDRQAKSTAAHLLQQFEIKVGAILPPTVPENQARLRIGLSSTHSPADLDALLSALQSLSQQGLVDD